MGGNSPEIDCNCDNLGEEICDEINGKIIRYAYCLNCGERIVTEED